MNRSPLALCIAALLGTPLGALAANVNEVEPNDSRATAQTLGAASFTSESVVNIFNSTVTSHATVAGTNGSAQDVDYYAITVGNAGDIAFFDIDGAEGVGGQVPRQLHTALALFDAAGNLLAFDVASNVDPGSTAPGAGTAADSDSFIGTYTFSAPGTYYLGVTNANWFDTNIAGFVSPTGTLAGALTRPDGQTGGDRYAGNSGPATLSPSGAYDAGTYTLHVSLQQQSTPTQLPIPPAALALMSLGLLGLGMRQLQRRA